MKNDNIELLYKLRNSTIPRSGDVHLHGSVKNTSLSKAILLADELGVNDLRNLIAGCPTADFQNLFIVMTQYGDSKGPINIRLNAFSSLDRAVEELKDADRTVLGDKIADACSTEFSTSLIQEDYFYHSIIYIENVPLPLPKRSYYIVDYHQYDIATVSAKTVSIPIGSEKIRNFVYKYLPIERFASRGFYDSNRSELGRRYDLTTIVPLNSGEHILRTDPEYVDYYYKKLNRIASAYMQKYVKSGIQIASSKDGIIYYDLNNGVVIAFQETGDFRFFDILSKNQFLRLIE